MKILKHDVLIFEFKYFEYLNSFIAAQHLQTKELILNQLNVSYLAGRAPQHCPVPWTQNSPLGHLIYYKKSE